ncbi:hypothetical protein GCM10027578_21460 [Spirosoma luteolum]
MTPNANATDFPTDGQPIKQVPRPAPAPPAPVSHARTLGISAAALLLGGASVRVAHLSSAHLEQSVPAGSQSAPAEPLSPTLPASAPVPLADSTPAPILAALVPTELEVAQSPTDAMPFGQAFSLARHEVGVGGVFSWHGRWYNTFEKDEWASLSLTQRHEFAGLLLGEPLPVVPLGSPLVDASTPAHRQGDPTLIEGELNGQRIMGLDFDHDGVIDTLVLEGADGVTYRVVDATGDQGLDTLMRYDAEHHELVSLERLEQPFVLSNDQFSAGLEAQLSRAVVDSILDADDPLPGPAVLPHEQVGHDELDDDELPEPDDDTYVSHGDVHDMDDDE